MAAQFIQETEIIDVSSLFILLYGPPGAWKTSIAQTAADPLTLDFDRGAHRAFNRRAVMRFDSWNDVSAVAHGSDAIKGKKTVVIDTIGRMLDSISAVIITSNPKHGSAHGGLTLQGYGVLKARFASWMAQMRLGGHDVVMLAHEKEEKDGDERYMRPDIQGGSYTEVMKFCDLVGYLSVGRQGQRVLDFNPSDRHLGKNAAGWGPIAVPDLKESRTFLADLLHDAKDKIGHTAQASAAIARVTDEWQARLDADPSIDDLNAMLPALSGLVNGTKRQVWHMITAHAQQANLSFDSALKVFVRKAGAA